MSVFRRLSPASAEQARASWSDDTGPVVVAVDGHARSRPAVEWAAAEASARRSPLHIVHVLSRSLPPDVFGIALLTSGPAEAAGALVLEEAARRARSVAPDLVISTDLQLGAAPAAVLAESRGAALIVVARGRRSAPIAPARECRLAWVSRTPVVVARLLDAPVPGPSAGRVVVGLGPAGHPAALAFALRAARRRGVGLTVLHAGPGPDDRPRTGDVDIRWRPVIGRAPAALVAESAGAALVVVGAPTRPRPLGRRQSIGRAAVDAVRSPVVVVPAAG